MIPSACQGYEVFYSIVKEWWRIHVFEDWFLSADTLDRFSGTQSFLRRGPGQLSEAGLKRNRRFSKSPENLSQYWLFHHGIGAGAGSAKGSQTAIEMNQ